MSGLAVEPVLAAVPMGSAFAAAALVGRSAAEAPATGYPAAVSCCSGSMPAGSQDSEAQENWQLTWTDPESGSQAIVAAVAVATAARTGSTNCSRAEEVQMPHAQVLVEPSLEPPTDLLASSR